MNLCEKVAFIALKDTKGPEIWLEASTERSESNPGRSLGIYRAYSDCCLEDSTSQRAKHPRKSDKSVFVSPLSFFFEHGFIGLTRIPDGYFLFIDILFLSIDIFFRVHTIKKETSKRKL